MSKIPDIAHLVNNPIKQLAVSGGIYDCITDPYDKLRNGDQYSSVMPDLERFAKLIIEECAKIADNAASHRLPASTYGDLIRKFGQQEDKCF